MYNIPGARTFKYSGSARLQSKTKSRFTAAGSAVDVSGGREENWPDEKFDSRRRRWLFTLRSVDGSAPASQAQTRLRQNGRFESNRTLKEPCL